MKSGLLVEAGPPLSAPDRGYWLIGQRAAGSPGDRFMSWLAGADSRNGVAARQSRRA